MGQGILLATRVALLNDYGYYSLPSKSIPKARKKNRYLTAYFMERDKRL